MAEKHQHKAPEEIVREMLVQWEEELGKLDAQKADQEFGRIQEAVRQIGARISHRMAASLQNRCAKCHKPLPARGPVDTIPLPRTDLIQGWINQFACSQKCADALRSEMHDREMKRLAAA